MAKKSLKYTEAIKELNTILDDLETENIDVDQLTEKVKRAIELIKWCKNKIAGTEMEIKKIIEEFREEEKQSL